MHAVRLKDEQNPRASTFSAENLHVLSYNMIGCVHICTQEWSRPGTPVHVQAKEIERARGCGNAPYRPPGKHRSAKVIRHQLPTVATMAAIFVAGFRYLLSSTLHRVCGIRAAAQPQNCT